MKTNPSPARPDGGFTLLESSIVLTIIVVVYCCFSNSVVDAVDFTSQNIGSADLQEIGRRTMDSIKTDISMTGRFTDATLGIPLPHVFTNGDPAAQLDRDFRHDTAALAARAATFPAAKPWEEPANPPAFVAPGNELMPLGIREFVFRLPSDVDGDGRVVSVATGAIEWGPELFGYLMIPNAQGSLNLVRRSVDALGQVRDEVLCNCVNALTFDTVATKAILPQNAVEVHLHLIRPDTRNRIQRLHLTTTVAMRNSQ